MFEKNIFEYIEPNKIGKFELRDITVERDDFRTGILKGTKIQLLVEHGAGVVMSNTEMERRTNYEIVRQAHGDVLIGGLGIGMIIFEVMEKQEVKSVTILEKNEEVIELMRGLPFNEKVTVVHADVFEWRGNDIKFDTVYMDIWNAVNNDIYEKEMKPLKQKCRKMMISKKENPNRYISCWAEYEAKNNMRLL